MKLTFLLAIAFLAEWVFSVSAAPIRLEGEPFRPSLPVVWEATNTLPRLATVYRLAKTSLSESAVSNAMIIGSFKTINRVQSGDTNMLLFQDKPDRTYMHRYLKVIPSQWFMEYYNRDANKLSGIGVPPFGEVEKLAAQYLHRFGIQTNQIAAKDFRLLSEQTATTLDHKGGHQTSQLVTQRGVTLFRRIDGIRDQSSCFRIDFADDAKSPGFQLGWPALEPVKSYRVGSRTEMLNWIKAGLAVKVEPAIETPATHLATTGPEHKPAPKALKVGQMELFYSKPLGPNHEMVPCMQLEVVQDNGTTNAPSFLLWCPIIDTGSAR